MKDHAGIDRRSLALARAIAAKIDADPTRFGFLHARSVLEKWLSKPDYAPDLELWKPIFSLSWEEARILLLDESEMGVRMRQSSPFTGILSDHERNKIFNEFAGQ